MFLGYVQLGQTLTRGILVKASGLPTNADAAPSFRVYNEGTTAIMTGNLTGPIDTQTGFYFLSIPATLANSFTSGSTYSVLVGWSVSSVADADPYTFTVV